MDGARLSTNSLPKDGARLSTLLSPRVSIPSTFSSDRTQSTVSQDMTVLPETGFTHGRARGPGVDHHSYDQRDNHEERTMLSPDVPPVQTTFPIMGSGPSDTTASHHDASTPHGMHRFSGDFGGYTEAARAPHHGRHVGFDPHRPYYPVPQFDNRRFFGDRDYYRDAFLHPMYSPYPMGPSPYFPSFQHGITPHSHPPSSTVTSATANRHRTRSPSPPPSAETRDRTAPHRHRARPPSPPPSAESRDRTAPRRHHARSPSPPPLEESGDRTAPTPLSGGSPISLRHEGSYSDISEEEDSPQNDQKLRSEKGKENRSSFKDAVAYLSAFVPDAVATAPPSSSRFRSVTESLASGDVEVNNVSTLKESLLLTNTLNHLECEIAGLPYPEESNPRRDGTPLPTGHFLKIKGDGKTSSSPGSHLMHSRLPPQHLHLSGSDLRLFSSPSSSKRTAHLDEATLKNFESIARRSVESASMASSFLDGLTVHLKEGETTEKEFQLNSEADPRAVQNLLWASSVAIADSMEMATKLYFNVVLARRDAALAESALKNPEAAGEMRVLPLDTKRLFGPALETKLKERAERAKEDRLCMPPPTPSPRQGHQRQAFRAPKSQQNSKRKSHPRQSPSDSSHQNKRFRPSPKPRPKPKESSDRKPSYGRQQKKSFQ